jgi:hypothetical protein
MKIERYKLTMKFITGPLGTQPQKDVATEYLGNKVAEQNGLPDDELATLPEELEKGTTAFHKLDGQPIYYDYQIKGFLKDAGKVFNGLRSVKNLRSKIDNTVFVAPRQIALHLPEGGAITMCERPLRAETAQGPRTALARSEELPAGTWLECHLEVYDGPISGDLLRDLLSYGERKGMGQWRNGGRGRFEYTLEPA